MTPYYDDGTCVIYHGDAFEVLPHLGVSADTVVTDPPFLVSIAHAGGGNYKTKRDPGNEWGDAEVIGRWFACALDVIRSASNPAASLLSFCSSSSYPVFYPHAFRRFDTVTSLLWDKGRIGTGRRWRKQFEMVLYAHNRDSYWDASNHSTADVLRFAPTPSTTRAHRVDKPVPLLRQMILPTTPPGGLILDPFMGGGSTLVAAGAAGFRAIGVEIEERYCEIAAKRLAQEVLAV